jgi:uncharacterized Zn-binding protein involved in type VI secretion
VTFTPCVDAADEPLKWCAEDGTVIVQTDEAITWNGVPVDYLGDVLSEGGVPWSFDYSDANGDKHFERCP